MTVPKIGRCDCCGEEVELAGFDFVLGAAVCNSCQGHLLHAAQFLAENDFIPAKFEKPNNKP